VGELGVEAWHCGARLRPHDDQERAAVRALAENARVNGVEARLETDGSLIVPGESITDPVAFVHALAGAARGGGAGFMLGARVTALARAGEEALAVELARGETLHARAVVNCAGLHADEVARMAGEDLVDIYPRKGEFLLFAASQDTPLDEILLPVPSALGKGVLVFATRDRRAVIAGPTAREREDKRDWSVEADARELILAKAQRIYPALEGREPIGAYAGLRPAGRSANYAIAPSRTMPGLVHVAAIRSTGLSASLGIGEHVVAMLTDAGTISPGPARPLPAPPPEPSTRTWWERAMQRSATGSGRS
jgi:glycerol-3-phosphate dehydrogenase